MDDVTYHARLRAVAATLRQARIEAERHLTGDLRDESPDWLVERLDGTLRALGAAADEIGRFIQDERSGLSAYALTPPDDDLYEDIGGSQ